MRANTCSEMHPPVIHHAIRALSPECVSFLYSHFSRLLAGIQLMRKRPVRKRTVQKLHGAETHGVETWLNRLKRVLVSYQRQYRNCIDQSKTVSSGLIQVEGKTTSIIIERIQITVSGADWAAYVGQIMEVLPL